MQAAQVMTFGAATIQPDASIREAARMMLDYRISGLPVVDQGGNLVGIITEGDLLTGITGDGQRRRWLEFILDPEKPALAAISPRAQTVGEAMTRQVITATEETPVQDIVKLMKANGIKRVPIVRDNKVVGIVSRADLLRGLALEAKMMPDATAEDYALRDQVLQALSGEARGSRTSINVLVQNGTVELRGALPDASLLEKLVSAARQVPGVKDVVNRLVVVRAHDCASSDA
ncbi:MAG TPA: CBS domain-containing protein [Hyphomicrobiaceae bacterium]|jgi:CBS domain-containing protein